MGNLVLSKQKSGFEKWEVGLLEKMFADLAKRSPGNTIDKMTFLQLFRLPGMLGERLFSVFDTNKNGVIDFDEFIEGLEHFSRKSIDDKISLLFKMYDLAGDNAVHSEELSVMLRSIITPPIQLLDGEEFVRPVIEESNETVDSVVKAAFESCDLEKNGSLSLEEFKKFIQESPKICEILEDALVHNSWGAALNSSIDKTASLQEQELKIVCAECSWTPTHCFICGNPIQSLKCSLCGPLFSDIRMVKFCMGCGHALTATTTVPKHSHHSSVSFVDPLSDPSAKKLIRSGYLFKRTSMLKQFRKRWFVLMSSFLYYYKDKTDVHPSGVKFIESCFIEEDDSYSPEYYAFSITSAPDDKLVLFATSPEDRQHWIIELRKAAKTIPITDVYTIGPRIGMGKFAMVHEGVEKKSNKKYAIKILDKTGISNKDSESLRNEIAILNVVRHPNIVSMKEVFETRDKMYIVMYMYPHGDLFRYIKAKSERFSETECKKIVWSIVQAVRYLHSLGIVHRDLKPENILVVNPKEPWNLVLSDFGLSKFATPLEEMKLACGTLSYVAPEVLKMTGYTKAVDYWSIGVLTYLLVSGRLPFHGRNQKETINLTLRGKVSFNGKPWDSVSQDAKDLIKDLMQKDSDARPDGRTVLNHPWFDEIRELPMFSRTNSYGRIQIDTNISDTENV